MPSAAFIWAKVLGHIENKMGAAATSAWFDDTNVVEITDHQLILSTPLRISAGCDPAALHGIHSGCHAGALQPGG